MGCQEARSLVLDVCSRLSNLIIVHTILSFIDLSVSNSHMSTFASAPIAFVYFTASWCVPCKAVSPVFDRLKQDSSAMFVRIDVDEDEKMVTTYSVDSVPTLLVFKKGELINRIVPNPRTFESFVHQHSA